MAPLPAAHWQHNFDPFLIRFPDGFFLPGIRWYGVAYLLGFLGGWLLLRVLAKRGRLGGVQAEEVSDLVFWAAVGAVLGGRVGYALLYNFQITISQPWTLIQVWQGGMASHGGIVGVALALTLWWSRRRPVADEAEPAPETPRPKQPADENHEPEGGEGEAEEDAEGESGEPGTRDEPPKGESPHVSSTSGMEAPGGRNHPSAASVRSVPSVSSVEAPRARKRHRIRAAGRKEDESSQAPAQSSRQSSQSQPHSPRHRQPAAGKRKTGRGAHAPAGRAGANAGDDPGGSFWRRWLNAARDPGFWRMGDGVVAVAPIGLFFGRVANFINGELWGRQSEVPWAVVFPDSPAPLVARHPSALYEAALEGIVLFLWLFPGVLRGRWREGGASVRFVIGYAAARFIVEFFREPDEGIGYQWLHLTRGQWLSVVMAAGGVGLLMWLGRIRKQRAGETQG